MVSTDMRHFWPQDLPSFLSVACVDALFSVLEGMESWEGESGNEATGSLIPRLHPTAFFHTAWKKLLGHRPGNEARLLAHQASHVRLVLSNNYSNEG